jgi:hypothetical protein
MKLTVTTQTIDHGLAAFRRKLAVLRLKKSYVKAGAMSNKAARTAAKPGVNSGLTNAELASIHEFGLGTVPARPFIRPPFVQHRSEYLAILRDAFRKSLRSNDPAGYRRALALVGQKMAADIKNYVTTGTGVPPPLAASTIKAKGSSRPLVDTGQLINSVTYEVVE